jgi:glutamine amidotransferase
MMAPTVTIVDYGMGNICSVVNAFRYLGCEPVISNDPDLVANAESLLLPGVGSFRKAMLALSDRGLDQAICHAVQANGRKILGICLGMQLLGISGSEDGETVGLGLIPESVGRFSSQEVDGAKIPHIGFNVVQSKPDSRLFCGLPESADFYFVHSYRMLANELNGLVATCNYGVDFVAAYENENVFATQFHPEKSQSNGLVLLKNFLEQ